MHAADEYHPIRYSRQSFRKLLRKALTTARARAPHMGRLAAIVGLVLALWPRCAAGGKAAQAKITPTGAWKIPANYAYNLDNNLAVFVAGLAGRNNSLLDVGAGKGLYVRYLRNLGLRADGVEGVENVAALTSGLIRQQDLSAPFERPCRAYEWVTCLEVAEHVPAASEETLLSSLNCSARTGVVLSWATPGQTGAGHVNLRSHDYVVRRMRDFGFEHDTAASLGARRASFFPWFRKHLAVFRRAGAAAPAAPDPAPRLAQWQTSLNFHFVALEAKLAAGGPMTIAQLGRELKLLQADVRRAMEQPPGAAP